MVGPSILSLFSGVGGLEVAVRLALPGSRVVGYVERDSYAAATLMARMEEQSMDLAPVFCGEIQDLDGRQFGGHVDVVCGGIPCQPYSLAGKQLGDEDDRALWHEFARVVAECGPSLVFIENVPTFVTRGGFRPLGEELCRLGFDVADPLFIGAGDVGAPHGRRRVFILAHRDFDRREVERCLGEPDEGIRSPQRDDADGRDPELADGEVGGRGELRGPPGAGGQPDGSDEGLADAASDGRAAGPAERRGGGEMEGPGEGGVGVGNRGQAVADAEGIRGGRDEPERGPKGRGPARRSGEGLADAGGSGRKRRKYEIIRCSRRGGKRRAASKFLEAQGGGVGEGGVPDTIGAEVRVESERGGGPAREAERRDTITGQLGFFPPGPDDKSEWMRIIGRYPGLAPAIEPGLRVVVDGVSMVLDEGRADQLRCAGNAVVVAQAYVAFRQLLRWIGGDDD